jgi:hypothetical protein
MVEEMDQRYWLQMLEDQRDNQIVEGRCQRQAPSSIGASLGPEQDQMAEMIQSAIPGRWKRNLQCMGY